MNLLKRTVVKFFKILILVLLPVIITSAQPVDPDDVGDTPVPITGLEYLLISGGLLGGYKILKRRFNGNAKTED